MLLFFHFDSCKKDISPLILWLWSVAVTEFVMRGISSLLLSVIPSVSQGRRKVWCFKSFMKGFTVAYWKQWWNGNSFFCVSSRLQFGPPKRQHFCFFLLIFSAQWLSPDSIGYFPIALSVYLTCSLFFSLFLRLSSPVPMYLTVILVLPIFLHMKPFDIIEIGRPKSFVCIKQQKSRQQTTDFDVTIVFLWVLCAFNCWWTGVPSLQLLNLFDYKCLVCTPPLVFLPFCWAVARYNHMSENMEEFVEQLSFSLEIVQWAFAMAGFCVVFISVSYA